MEAGRLTREELVKLGLALPLAVAVAGTETTLAATPACADDGRADGGPVLQAALAATTSPAHAGDARDAAPPVPVAC